MYFSSLVSIPFCQWFYGSSFNCRLFIISFGIPYTWYCDTKIWIKSWILCLQQPWQIKYKCHYIADRTAYFFLVNDSSFEHLRQNNRKIPRWNSLRIIGWSDKMVIQHFLLFNLSDPIVLSPYQISCIFICLSTFVMPKPCHLCLA